MSPTLLISNDVLKHAKYLCSISTEFRKRLRMARKRTALADKGFCAAHPEVEALALFEGSFVDSILEDF
ncbi:hypothetical protein MLD38_018259 [Melastoma candidum]|uniref:Uncharacterized protein n=1 Tax=Melastoma candidum TaxID=119954 RepID=A0ACB9QWR8_9MYRT|nr:hypothetical protein MLD38_018259 [Melastoma candidum]